MMPVPIRASVPGKVILMGEHSAVYGYPALVAAFGRRVGVELIPGGSGIDLDLRTLGYRERCSWQDLVDYRDERSQAWSRFASAEEGIDFGEVRGEDPAHVVKVAMGEVVCDLGAVGMQPARLIIDSDIPVGSGFGSSAAVAVAVVAVCLRYLAGEAEPERIARLALEVERRQHGHPSGVDHSAVLYGGVLRVSRGEVANRIPVADWVGREMILLDTGRPDEPTGEVVAAVRRRKDVDERAFSQVMERMERNVTEFESLLGSPQPEVMAVRRVIGDFERCLEELGVVPGEIQQKIRAVEDLGAVAKISGAGSLSGQSGGCLLVCRPGEISAQVLETFAGYPPVEGSIGAEGLRFEEAA